MRYLSAGIVLTLAVSSCGGTEASENDLRDTAEDFYEDFFQADVNATYPVLSERCQDVYSKEDYAGLLALAVELYGEVKVKVNDVRVDGDEGRVEGETGIPALDEDDGDDSPQWTFEDGGWRLDRCGEESSSTDDTATEDIAPAADSVEVVEVGFGQDPGGSEYAHGVAVVQADGDAAVGHFIVVSMNFLNEAGDTIITEQQTESISWADQKVIIPVFASLGSEIAVSEVEATVAITNEGGGSGEPIPGVSATEVRQGEYGGTTAKFTFANPLTEALVSPRIGVLCRDADGAIIGGDSHYPDLVPAGAEIVENVDVSTRGKPATCEATINHS